MAAWWGYKAGEDGGIEDDDEHENEDDSVKKVISDQ